MSRDKDYQRLLNSRRWRELRRWKLQRNPLCELCLEEGFTSSAVDVHHIEPVERAHSIQEMEALCFNPANLRSLCIACHVRVHREMKSQSKEEHRKREEERQARWAKKFLRPPS